MNREILFRAKRKDNGEWIEGLLIHIGMYSFNDIEDIYVEYVLGIQHLDKSYEINPSTLCQFTGLLDENQKKIWENDIVSAIFRTSYDMYSLTGIVQWCGGAFEVEECIKNEDFTLYGWLHDTIQCNRKVLGNIFDNPELLEERKL